MKQNKEVHQKVDRMETEMESLKQDNISLYEKIKYLQSYGSLNQGDRVYENRYKFLKLI